MSRDIPITNGIKLFFHCSNCINERPEGMSPSEWVSLEAGWTDLGLQIWCKRCNMNVIHVDFEGQQHPACLEAMNPNREKASLH